MPLPLSNLRLWSLGVCIAVIGSAALLLSSGGAAAVASRWSCVKTDDGSVNRGPDCGPYRDRSITSNGASVLNDMWNPPGAGHPQTIRVDNPGHWEVTSDQARGNTAVLSFPDVQVVLSTSKGTPAPLAPFASITGGFDESMPSSGDNEAAYDIWMGKGSSTDYAQEVMIWTDDHRTNSAPGHVVARVKFGGAGYAIWQDPTGGTAGFRPTFLVRDRNERAGTVPIGTMLTWLIAHHLTAATGVNEIDFGWEICSTGGRPETFVMHHYFLHMRCRGGGSRCYSS
jgi:hypothetical protein